MKSFKTFLTDGLMGGTVQTGIDAVSKIMRSRASPSKGIRAPSIKGPGSVKYDPKSKAGIAATKTNSGIKGGTDR